jgi:hypothetical protein
LKYRKYNKEFRVLGTCRLEISISSPFRKLQEKYEITECNLLQKKTSSNMVATAEVSKNVSFFQLSICSVNDSEKKRFVNNRFI